MYSNAVAPQASSAAGGANSTSFGGGIDGMFMRLLITQLQNQDPLSPMDPSSFVSQLVGVNTLDQVSQIHQLLQSSFETPTSTSSAGGH